MLFLIFGLPHWICKSFSRSQDQFFPSRSEQFLKQNTISNLVGVLRGWRVWWHQFHTFLWPCAHELWKDRDHRGPLPSKLPRRLPGKKQQELLWIHVFNSIVGSNYQEKFLQKNGIQKKYINSTSVSVLYDFCQKQICNASGPFISYQYF